MSAAKTSVRLVVLIASLAIVCVPVEGADAVRFTVVLPGSSYAAAGPIPLRMTLANGSSQPARVSGRFAVNDEREPPAFHEVTVVLRAPSGRHAAFRRDIKIHAARAGDVVTLPPGGSASKTVDLARYYLLDERGAYEVRATYAATAPGALPGPIVSNTVRFTVR